MATLNRGEREPISAAGSAGRGSIAGLMSTVVYSLVLRRNPEMVELAMASAAITVGLLNGLGNAARNVAGEKGITGFLGKLFSFTG